MLFGNHKGNVENIWLIVLAVVVFLGVGLWVARPTFKQRTTVTARNQPEGHVEPVWSADQLNLTGAYADLSDDELRSQNIDPATLNR